MFSINDIFLYNPKAPLIFSQYYFLAFFTIIIFVLAFLKDKRIIRNSFFIIISCFFYYKTGGFYFILLLASTIYDYYLANAIYNSKIQWKRKLYLFISLFINLGLLAFFKYSYYFVDIINGIFDTKLQAINIFSAFSNELFSTNFDITKIILPVGISFFTFQTLSYTIDIYRKHIEPAKNLLDFGFFVTYFPLLIAGPIVRAVDFIPQIYKNYSITRRELGHAIFLIACGFIKKTMISDYVSVNFVDRVFDDPQLYGGFENLIAVYGYAIQIYCDFSGYSDMAIGISLLMGFHLPINFNSPYVSTSITEFWRRWHISLSTWLRDYLYISLGGNRKGKFHQYKNLLITMLIGGFWHGAATKFIIWGGLHGIALAIHKMWIEFVPFSKKNFFGKNLIAGLITFHFVCFCWIYFRAKDMAHVNQILNRIFHFFDPNDIMIKIKAYWEVMAVLLLGFVFHFISKSFKLKLEEKFSYWHLVLQILVFAVIIFLSFQIKSAEVKPFIYFDF